MLRTALRALFRRRQLEADLDAELQDHVERDVQARMARGLAEPEARRAALADLGGVVLPREGMRDARLATVFDDIGRDVRFGLRRFRRAPGWAALVVLTIGLGVGATTTMFTVVDGVLLKPLPLYEPQELVTIWQTRPSEGITRDDVAPATFLDFQARARTLTSMSAGNPWGVTMHNPGSNERVDAWKVTDGFFQSLGPQPALGRSLRADDFLPGREPVAILDHGFWQRRFGGDPRVVGQRVNFDGATHTIVGVMPPTFIYPERTNLWLPWVLDSAEQVERFATYIKVFARLAPGASISEAQSEMTTIAAHLEREHPRSNTDVGASVESLTDVIIGDQGPLLWTLLMAAVVLLIVTVVNVASLQLTRLDRQERETGVRLALGARRMAVVRPLLVESLMLCLAGGLVGAALAWGSLRALQALSLVDLVRFAEVTLDWRALLVAAGFATLAGMAIGAVSARRAWGADVGNLSGMRGMAGTHAGTRLRRAAVAGQLALALVLLIGAGLLVRSFREILSQDQGFRTAGTLSFSMWVYDEFPTTPGREAFVRQVIERLQQLPGVDRVGMGSALPLADDITGEEADIIVDGAAVQEGVEQRARGIVVWPGYFETLGTPLRRGRSLSDADGANAERVVLVNEAFVRRFSPDRDPIGRQITVGLMGRPVPRRIVGVVGDTRHARLDGPPEPGVFIPWQQQPLGALTFIVHTSGDPSLVATSVARTVYEVDRRLAIDRLTTLSALLDRELRDRRAMLFLVGAFAAVALLVACVGVFGVMSQAVSERTREIGVRMALGAGPRRIAAQFVREAAWIATGGVIVGVALAALGTQLIVRFLYGTARFDPAALLIAAAVLIVCTLLAALLPTMRASRTPPAVVIQS